MSLLLKRNKSSAAMMQDMMTLYLKQGRLLTIESQDEYNEAVLSIVQGQIYWNTKVLTLKSLNHRLSKWLNDYDNPCLYDIVVQVK